MTIQKLPVSEIRDKFRKAYRGSDDPLFELCMNSLPAVPVHALCYFRDGDKYCCVFGDFRNLPEDPAGFGDTETEAYCELRKQMNLKREVTNTADIERHGA